jgi:hypothetical protein
MGHVVELGCGPFTQLQTILPGRPRPASITLLDPLLESYASKVRGCPYSTGKLLGTRVSLVAAPLEELELPQQADVLLMISLLQSVRDVPAAMQARLLYSLPTADYLLLTAYIPHTYHILHTT